MRDEQLTLAQMQEFTDGNRNVQFVIEGRSSAYGFIEIVLKTQRYRRVSKGQRGIVRRFLTKATGFSRAQITRLLTRWMRTKRVLGPPVYRPVLSETLHGRRCDAARLGGCRSPRLSGPAVRHILRREFQVFGKPEYQRLAEISVSHLYNLRHSVRYKNQRIVVRPTQSRQVSIAERRKPDPRGRPGYLRVDTVHQGNLDGHPSLYHINAVDTVTQWQIVGCVETISERHLIPVLEAGDSGEVERSFRREAERHSGMIPNTIGA